MCSSLFREPILIHNHNQTPCVGFGCPKSCFNKFHKTSKIFNFAFALKNLAAGARESNAIGYNIKSAVFNSYIQFLYQRYENL